MNSQEYRELNNGIQAAFIDSNLASESIYQPRIVVNHHESGERVSAVLEDELQHCDSFQISVAFITNGGFEPLAMTLKELEKKGIPGEILTTSYMNFSEPSVLKRMQALKNIHLRIFDTEAAGQGFHTKGYIFRKDEIYRIIIGSSNLTSAALSTNQEWNTELISTRNGAICREIQEEFRGLWSSQYAREYDEFIGEYEERYRIARHQREIARKAETPSLIRYRLRPNTMQVNFISNLRKIVQKGEKKALLISATGTGKTYAAAFAMRELNFQKVLFLVHRSHLMQQTINKFRNVFGDTVSMGMVGDGHYDYDKDYIFAMVETVSKEKHLKQFYPDEFDCIVIDEAHHSSADTYQKIMQYFQPKLWLGMTATPDKRDDHVEGKNIYALFDYHIAYEIRLQEAMEQDLLCPFHYFGLTDLRVVNDISKDIQSAKKLTAREFSLLTSDERVEHILREADYYGYSGDRVRGLIFCSRVAECQELSRKFNERGLRTTVLTGESNGKSVNGENYREQIFERLAMREEEATENKQPLDYIFSVDVLNEGVDIVEVNQVIMLRPTKSPIIFIQQLGRGLRKAEGKEFVVVLDFIGNYDNNFMIPVALSGDRTYNADTIRKYVISGNRLIPGASTVHFDEIARKQIFQAIDHIQGIRSLIRTSYINLKNRLGRVPYLLDFYESGEVDPLLIVREYKTYHQFLKIVEKQHYTAQMTSKEQVILEYYSRTILSGVRPDDLELINYLLQILKNGNLSELAKERQNPDKTVSDEARLEQYGKKDFRQKFEEKYGYTISEASLRDSLNVANGHFVSKKEEYDKKYYQVDLIPQNREALRQRIQQYHMAQNREFYRQLQDLVDVGLRRYQDIYSRNREKGTPFVLYEKYSRRDISLLMHCGKDASSTMFGMKRIDEDVFIFVTYHKDSPEDQNKLYADGKPDYADAFEDNQIFRWDSQIGRGIESSYVHDVVEAKRRHLLIKKSDRENSFYYMGLCDVINCSESQKRNNKGKMQPITKFRLKMHHVVRDDLLDYFNSEIVKIPTKLRAKGAEPVISEKLKQDQEQKIIFENNI